MRCAAGKAVPEVTSFTPGEDAAMDALNGKDGFATSRLKTYNTDRNNPNKPKVRPQLHTHAPQRGRLPPCPFGGWPPSTVHHT